MLVLVGYCVSLVRPYLPFFSYVILLRRFYGINLNQNVVLQQIHFDGSEGTPWTKLFKIATGNLIITALGFVPGMYFSRSTFYVTTSAFVSTYDYELS